MAEPTTSKLSRRLAAAAQRITATRATEAQQAAPTAPKPTPAARDANATTTKAKATRARANVASDTNTAQPSATSTKGAKRGRSDEDRGFMGSPSARAAAGSVTAVAASIRSQARNPDALQLVSDDELVEIARAMVENAKQRGSTGAMDRQALFRAAGLPFVATGSGKNGPQAGGAQVRDRLQAALNRGRRQAAVTGAKVDGTEASVSAEIAA